MTDDDDDEVTVPGDHEVIAELRRRHALDAAGEGAGAPAVPNRAPSSERRDPAPDDESDDDVTLEAEAEVIAEIREAAAAAAEPEAEPTPLPPPQLGTLPPPQVTPVAQVPAAAAPAGARWQPPGRLPVAQRVEPRPTVPARIVRARWYIVLAVAAAALVIGAIFSLRDGDDGPAPRPPRRHHDIAVTVCVPATSRRSSPRRSPASGP